MQRRHSPLSLRDGFTELSSPRRGTPQSETSELTLTPKKKDRKWTLSGLFRRRKNKSSDTEYSSSLEEISPDNNNKHKPGFLKRKLSLKKKPSGSRKVVGKFEFTKNAPSNEKHQTSLIINRDLQFSGNSSEKLSSLNSSSLSSKQKFDSLTLLQTGSSCGSLNSSGKRSSKNDVKARVEAEHEKLKDSSSDDEFRHARKYHSQDNINDSLKRRSRAARTERYLKRLNQINNLSYHQQAELLRMLERNKISMKQFMLEPQTYLKAQSANSSLTNSPLPNIKFTFCPNDSNNSPNNFYVNLADANSHKSTKSYSKPSPILPRHSLRQIDFNSANSVDDRHIYMNVSTPNTAPSSKVPPMPPPRDPHRKVIYTSSSPSSFNVQQRPVSYAFEAPKFTSVDNLASRIYPVSNFSGANGNFRSNSEQHIGDGLVYSPTDDRPASVLQFTTDIDYATAPTDYQYITDQKPRSRRPIQIECTEQSNDVTNNLTSNNRLYFSDQHINSYRFENGSNSRSTINSSEEQLWRLGGKLHQSDSTATTADYSRNAVTDSRAHFQFNKANKIDHSDLDHSSDHVPSPTVYLSRRNSKEIGQFVRPLSMVLEKSESEVESSKPNSRISTSKSVPPDPPVRKNFNNAVKKRVVIGGTDRKMAEMALKNAPKDFKIDSVKSVDIDELLEFNKQHNPSYNLEEALNELEEIYKSLQLSDDDLLDRAERRDVPAQLHAILSREIDSDSSCDVVDSPIRKRRERTRSLSTDRKKDDMAYRRIFKTDNPNFVPKLDTCNIMSQAGSFLLVSPTLAPPVFSNVSEPPMSPDMNEPDVTYDDVVFRSIKHVNNSLKTLDPQPPFGIPVGPITQASSSDYLHAIPEDRYKPTFSSRKTPDVVKDDLAFRNLRKDLNHNPHEYRKKRAVRSLSANLTGVLSRAEKLKYSFPHPLSYARSSSYNDLPKECFKEYSALEPSISQFYSSASTESLTDFDVSEFLRYKTPANYEELLRKFNSKFENSVLHVHEKSSPVPSVVPENSEESGETVSNSSDQSLGKTEVQELIKAIEHNKLDKTSLKQKKIIQHKPIVLSAFNSTVPIENGAKNDVSFATSTPKNQPWKSDDSLVADHIKDSFSNNNECVNYFENASLNLKSAKKSPFNEIRDGLSETPLKPRQILDLKLNDDSKCNQKTVITEAKNNVTGDSEGSSESVVPIDSISLRKCLNTGLTTDKNPAVGDTLNAKFEQKEMILQSSVEIEVSKQNSPSVDTSLKKKRSKSKESPASTAESGSGKSFELKTRRHSKIEIPEKFVRSKNDGTSGVAPSDLKSNCSSESDLRTIPSKSPKLKKKRLSQIDIPEKCREGKESSATGETSVLGASRKSSSEFESKVKSSKSPKLKKKRLSQVESTENPSITDVSLKDSNAIESLERDKKLKSSKSPKLKKKRLSQVETSENFRESKEISSSSDQVVQGTDSKSSSSLERDESNSSKSVKSKSKRLNQMGVSEKFRKSMEHLASSYAVDQEPDLKFGSSSSEGDSKVKLAKIPKSKKKRLSQIEIPDKCRESKENLTSRNVSSQEADSKSHNSSERDPKSRPSKSPKLRRKRSSLTESPEKKKENNVNPVIYDISIQNPSLTPDDSTEKDLKASLSRSPNLRHSSKIEIPEKFRQSNENLPTTEISSENNSPKSENECKPRRKRSSQIEIPEKFRHSNENLVSPETLAEYADLKTENDLKASSSKSPNLRRKRSSQIEIPEKFRHSNENLVSPEILAECVDLKTENDVKASSSSLRRKRSSQIEIPEKFRQSIENLATAEISSEHSSLKSENGSSEKVKRPSKIEIPEIFRESRRKSSSSENLVTQLNLGTEPNSLSEAIKSPDIQTNVLDSSTCILSSNNDFKLVRSDEERTNAVSLKNNEKEPPKPLKSILKKTEFKVEQDLVESKRISIEAEPPTCIEKTAEDSGVVVESMGESFLTPNDFIEHASLENSKIPDLEGNRNSDEFKAPVFRSELNCPIQNDGDSNGTKSPPGQNQAELVNLEIEKILKKYENSVSNGSCLSGDGFKTGGSQERSSKADLCTDLMRGTVGPVLTGKLSPGACFGDNAELDSSKIGNGHLLTPAGHLKSSSSVEPDVSDKNEIVFALSELTSKMAVGVTAETRDMSLGLDESREPKVTNSTKPLSGLTCLPDRRNVDQKSRMRAQDNQSLVRRSPKSANQACFAKSSSSCSDFEGIALSTSSLLAASYCFACLLQSDYLSLVNLMTAVIVLVACFVLYHVLAAE